MSKRYREAAFIVCLFLCGQSSARVADPQWKFDPASQRAYDLALDLQFEKVHELLQQPQTVQENYVLSLAETLELLLEEDGEKYTDYQSNFEQRKERKTKLNSPDDLFLQAEMAVQWAFVYFKFGHEFDAALNLREAYFITTELRKRFPAYQAINKTAALLEVIIGAVPEKYNWVLSLLNIEGSVQEGLAIFAKMSTSDSPLKLESDLMNAVVQCYVLQKPDSAIAAFDRILAKYPDRRLVLFLGASLAMKSSKSEKALSLLDKLQQQPGNLIDYTDYLKGEIFLHKAEYLNSITAFRSFTNHYKGQNNIKDAYYKIGLCYWLNGNNSDALAVFKQAKNIGREATESDKYAARSMAESELPHLQLTKARYFTDGGYYNEARAILDSVTTFRPLFPAR